MPRRRGVLSWLGLGLTAATAETNVPAAGQGLAVGSVLPVGTVDALMRLQPKQATAGGPVMCDLAGYHQPGDGGGGLFDWQPGATTAADGFLVFRPAATAPGAPGRWVRRLPYDGAVTFEMAGAVGDGTTDDWPAADRVMRHLGAVGGGLIKLLPTRRYLLSQGLDLGSHGLAGIVIEGASAPLRNSESWIPDEFQGSRIVLPPGRTVQVGPGCIVRRLLIWRQGLPDKPTSLADIRRRVNQWFQEDGVHAPLSTGITVLYPNVTIEHVMVVGFHTGIRLQGGNSRVERCYVDCAGYGIECTKITGTCQISEVVMFGMWSTAVAATVKDALGDHGYRPGTAIYAHDRCDGLQINSCQAEHWVNGLILRNVWLVSVFQFNAETPENDGQPTYGIWTQEEVRHVNIIDPRLVTMSTTIRFSHATPTSDVTLIGGSLEMNGASGHCIELDAGTSGQIFGTMVSNPNDVIVAAAPGIRPWKIVGLKIWASAHLPWLSIAPASLPMLYLAGTRALDGHNERFRQSHINERTVISTAAGIPTADGSPDAPMTVECISAARGPVKTLALHRNGVEVGSLQATAEGLTVAARQIGFFGAVPADKPVVTGAKGDNPALASLLAALARLGLLTDRTSA